MSRASDWRVRRRLRLQAAALALCAVLGACATSPSERLYTLMPYGEAHRAAPATGWRIELGPVSVPERIDHMHLVLVEPGSRVMLLEQDRWAEPLPTAIGRVVAADMARELGSGAVWAYPERGLPDPQYRISIDVQRLDADARQVRLSALWSVKSLAAPAPGAAPAGAQSGSSAIDEPVTGHGVTAIVEAHSRALAAMAAEIARVLPQAPPNPP